MRLSVAIELGVIRKEAAPLGKEFGAALGASELHQDRAEAERRAGRPQDHPEAIRAKICMLRMHAPRLGRDPGRRDHTKLSLDDSASRLKRSTFE